MPKNIETTAQWQSSLTLPKECSKFSQLGFKRLWTEKFQIFMLNLTKRNQRSNWKYPLYCRKSKRVPETHLLLFHWLHQSLCVDHNKLWNILFFFFLFVVNFVMHWNETAMGLHVFPIPIPPPTSLSTRSPEVFPVHQVRALVSCIQPGLVICFTLDTIHVLMLFSWNIPPSPSPTESKRLFYKSVSLFLYIIIFIHPSSSISLKYSCPSISVGDCF